MYFKEFSAGSLAFFAQPLIKTASAFLKEVKVDDKGIRDLTKPTIIELIQRGRCVCGQEICEGNDAYKHLMEELSYVPLNLSATPCVITVRSSLVSHVRQSEPTMVSTSVTVRFSAPKTASRSGRTRCKRSATKSKGRRICGSMRWNSQISGLDSVISMQKGSHQSR